MIAELPLAVAARPSPMERLVKTVSASRLQCWHQCRLKFYFRYVLEIRKPSTAALHVGKVVHAVLQAWNLARWRGEKFELEGFKPVLEVEWKKQQIEGAVDWDGEEEKEKAHTWALIQAYLAETPVKANERPEGVEVSVEADLGLIKLIGIMDLVRSGGRIVDFKTSGKTPDPVQVEHQHQTQLSCYALLYRDATGKKESGLELHHLIKTKVPKIVITTIPPMTEPQESRLLRIIDSYLEGLVRKDFVPAVGFQCAGCEYAKECRQWGGKERDAALQ